MGRCQGWSPSNPSLEDGPKHRDSWNPTATRCAALPERTYQTKSQRLKPPPA